jgi:hypothetical protein
MLNERPTCDGCEFCRLRMQRDAGGWEAYCTAMSKGGKFIAVQYGLKLNWAKRELLDRLNTRICPSWCPKWQRGDKNGTLG